MYLLQNPSRHTTNQAKHTSASTKCKNHNSLKRTVGLVQGGVNSYIEALEVSPKCYNSAGNIQDREEMLRICPFEVINDNEQICKAQLDTIAQHKAKTFLPFAHLCLHTVYLKEKELQFFLKFTHYRNLGFPISTGFMIRSMFIAIRAASYSA